MAGFIRRFDAQPTIETLAEIEAIDIVDLPPQSPTTGVGTGTLLCVGEFEDGSFADGSDANEYQGPATGPQEVFGSEDLVNRFGGFGYAYGGTLYENPCARRHLFELWNGNGFIKLKFCRPRRLIVARVDTSVGSVAFSPLAGILGGSGPFALTVGDTLDITTDLGGPVSSSAIAAAGAQVTGAAFLASGFLGGEAISFAIDGGPVVTVTFAAADQTPAQVAARINLVLGYACASVVGGALQLDGIVQGTSGEIILADVAVGTLAAIGLLAGTTAGTGNVGNLSAVTATEVAGIVNGTAGLVAISAGASIDSAGRVRLLRTGGPGTILLAATSMAGVCQFAPLATTITAGEHSGGSIPAGTRVSDGATTWVTMQTLTIASGTATSPNVGPHVVKVRPATDDGTAGGAAVLTVVTVLDQPSFSDLSVTNALALSPALTENQLDVAYEAAFDRTVDLANVVREVSFSISARRSDAVVRKGRANAIDASAGGLYGRKFITGAPLGYSRAQAIADVANYRSERLFYTYPGWKVRIPEIAYRGSAGGLGFSDSGVITVRADAPLATIDCQLPPEENPGQQTGLIENFFGVEDVIESGKLVTLGIDSYVAFKAAGICAPRRDATSGSVYQSGVTSDITAGKKTQARRKMADYIQDTLAARLVPFSKRLATPARRDSIRAVIEQFLGELQSINQPETARIDSYLVDETSGQTPELTARGIFVFIVKVRTLSSLDAIVLQTEIGEGVVTATELA